MEHPSRQWLYLILALAPVLPALAFLPGTAKPSKNLLHPTVRSSSVSPWKGHVSYSTSSSHTHLFSWFSTKQLPWFSKDKSNEDKKDVWGDESSKDSSSPNSKASLGGVAGIMDSMENFKTAQQVGKMTNALVQELTSMMIEGQAAEGKVKVYFDGQQRPLNVVVDEGYLENVDASDLNTALTAAMKDAYQKSSERMDEKMKSFYVDLGLKENK